METNESFIARFTGKTETIQGLEIRNGKYYKCTRINSKRNGWVWFDIRPFDQKGPGFLDVMCFGVFAFLLPGRKSAVIPYGSISAFLENFEVINIKKVSA